MLKITFKIFNFWWFRNFKLKLNLALKYIENLFKKMKFLSLKKILEPMSSLRSLFDLTRKNHHQNLYLFPHTCVYMIFSSVKDYISNFNKFISFFSTKIISIIYPHDNKNIKKLNSNKKVQKWPMTKKINNFFSQ